MEITKIILKNKHGFKKILPPHIKYQNSESWGCIIEGKAVATAVMNIGENGGHIFWLWVAPDYRNQGVATALLQRLCQSAEKEYKKMLTITYPADSQWAVILEYLLLKLGFTLELSVYPGFRFTRQQLLDAPFMMSGKLGEDKSVVPLSQVSLLQIKELAAESSKEGGYLISGSDFAGIDEDRSMVLLNEGHIQGLTLISCKGAEDILSLDLFYLKKSAGNGALTLLRQTAKRVLSHPAGFSEFQFLCTEEVAVKICRQLMGEQKPEELEYCHGRY